MMTMNLTASAIARIADVLKKSFLIGLALLAAAVAFPSSEGSTAGLPPDQDGARIVLHPWEPQAKIPALRLSVKTAGAKGDGKTDDTKSIQAAVNTVSGRGGGVVYFPNGVYKVSDSIVVRHDKVALEGEGWGADIQMVKHPKRVIIIEDSKNNVVRDLKISMKVPKAVRNDEDEGIYVTSQASHFLIEKVWGSGKGIMVRGDVNYGVIRNNRIQDTLADGIHLTGGSRYIQVADNELTNTGDDSIAVVSYRSQNTLTRQIVITGNRVRNSLARGIVHVGGFQVDILRNSIEGTSSSGILVDQDATFDTYAAVNTKIEGNTVAGAGTYGRQRGNQFGIEITSGAAYVSLIGNTITGATARGISVSADGTVIRNNDSSDNAEAGLEVHADGCRIIGNRFASNGTYGFAGSNSDHSEITGNLLTDNNVRGIAYVDNFLLYDSSSSVVKDNRSVETRADMRIERAFELSGTCRDTVFEGNQAEGTRLGTLVGCTP